MFAIYSNLKAEKNDEATFVLIENLILSRELKLSLIRKILLSVELDESVHLEDTNGDDENNIVFLKFAKLIVGFLTHDS
jgi:hypothetical protein